jgi:hypothetical protein
VLKAAARHLGLDAIGISGGPLETAGSPARHLWSAVHRNTTRWGSTAPSTVMREFRDLVLARIVEPISKQNSLRVLAETRSRVGVYRTVNRRLLLMAKPAVRQALSAMRLRAGFGPVCRCCST